MARSRGSIHIADNSVVAINDALEQLLFMLDELTGEHDTQDIAIGPHSHTSGSGDLISHDTGLTDVSADDHHNKLHSSHHGPSADDALKLDDLASPDDNTDLNAAITAHGLLPKLSGSSNEFLNGQGAFATVVAVEANDVANVEGDATTPIWEQILAGTGITITEIANGSAIQIDASGSAGGSAGKQFVLMMAEF